MDIEKKSIKKETEWEKHVKKLDKDELVETMNVLDDGISFLEKMLSESKKKK